MKEKVKNTRALLDKHKELVARCEELEEENNELKLRVAQEAAASVKGVPERERQLKTEYEGQISVLQDKLSRAGEQVKKAQGQVVKGVDALEHLKAQNQARQEKMKSDMERLERELKESKTAESYEKAAREAVEKELAEKDKSPRELQQTVPERNSSLHMEQLKEISSALNNTMQDHWKTMVALCRAAGFDGEVFKRFSDAFQSAWGLMC